MKKSVWQNYYKNYWFTNFCIKYTPYRWYLNYKLKKSLKQIKFRKPIY